MSTLTQAQQDSLRLIDLLVKVEEKKWIEWTDVEFLGSLVEWKEVSVDADNTTTRNGKPHALVLSRTGEAVSLTLVSSAKAVASTAINGLTGKTVKQAFSAVNVSLIVCAALIDAGEYTRAKDLLTKTSEQLTDGMKVLG